MLDYLRIDGIDLHDYVGATGNRDIVSIDGLIGLTDPRVSKGARTERHGSRSYGRYLGDRPLTLRGEIWGNDIVGAFREHRVITSLLYRTLSEGAKLLTWREGNALTNDPRVGLTNLVTNPSFEGDATGAAPAGYTGGGGGAVASTDWAQFGTKSAKLAALASFIFYDVTGLTPGTTYAVSTYIRTTGTAAARVTCSDGFGGSVQSAADAASLAGTTRVSLAYVVPASGIIRVALNNISGAGNVYFDGVSVVAGALVTYFDGDSSPGAIWLGNVNVSRSMFVGPVYQALVKLAGPELPPIEEGAALLRYDVLLEQDDPRAYLQALQAAISSAMPNVGAVTNPGFEVDTSNWTIGGAGTALTRVLDWHYAGIAAGRLVGAVAAAIARGSEAVGAAVTAGETYRGSARARIDVNTGGVKIIIAWWTAANAFVSQTDGPTVTTTGETLLTVEGVAPATATKATVGIQQVGAGAIDVRFDAVTLEAERSLVVVNPGNIETPPVVRLVGPLTAPRYVLTSTGEQVVINGSLLAGQTLEIDHAVPSVKLNGARSMALFNSAQSQIFDIPGAPEGQARVPQTVQLRAQGGTGRIEVDCRGAYVL